MSIDGLKAHIQPIDSLTLSDDNESVVDSASENLYCTAFSVKADAISIQQLIEAVSDDEESLLTIKCDGIDAFSIHDIRKMVERLESRQRWLEEEVTDTMNVMTDRMNQMDLAFGDHMSRSTRTFSDLKQNLKRIFTDLLRSVAIILNVTKRPSRPVQSRSTASIVGPSPQSRTGMRRNVRTRE